MLLDRHEGNQVHDTISNYCSSRVRRVDGDVEVEVADEVREEIQKFG